MLAISVIVDLDLLLRLNVALYSNEICRYRDCIQFFCHDRDPDSPLKICRGHTRGHILNIRINLDVVANLPTFIVFT